MSIIPNNVRCVATPTWWYWERGRKRGKERRGEKEREREREREREKMGDSREGGDRRGRRERVSVCLWAMVT